MLELDTQKIKEPQFVEQLTKTIEEMVDNNMISEAGRFIYNLNNTLQKYPNFNREYPDLYQKYQKLINYANYIALIGLTDEEIFDLFKNNFISVFEILEINPIFDLIGKIRGFLVGMPVHQWRNSFKKDLINKLFENEEKITSAPLKDPTGKKMAPTIGNWLKDYRRVFGPTAHVDKVKQLEYLTNSQNTKNLSTEEKDKLRYLFNLYEFLKMDSLTPEGVEESVLFEADGKLKILSGGRLEEIRVETAGPEPAPAAEEPAVAEIKIEPEKVKLAEGGEEVMPVVEEPKIEEKFEKEEVPEDKEAPEKEIPEKEAPSEIEKTAEIKKDLSADLSAVAQRPEAEALAKAEVAPEKKELPLTDLGIEEISKEVEEIKKETPTPAPPVGLTVDQAIDEVIKSLELSFSDETAERRFKNILQTYLNGVRDQIDTLVVLKRPVKIGGMGFDESKAEEVLWLLKDVQAKLIKQAEEIKTTVAREATKPALAEGMVGPEEMLIKPEQVKKEAPQPEFDKVKFEAGPLWRPKGIASPLVKKEPVIGPAEKEEMLRILEGREDKEPQSKLEKETVVPIRRPVGLGPGKRVLEDVKMKPRIYGPLEELKTIKLADWRSWGSPQESVNRVQDKIEFLAEESLIKKAQGIKAWQSSEVYRLYLEIGEEALEKQQSVETIIKLREKERRPYLTPDGFNKISELNQRLRF